MPHHTHTFDVETSGPGMIELTRRVGGWVERSGIQTGLLTVFCRHTSASLAINENAAQAVQRDILAWLDRMAPQGDRYDHADEGPDDMPAHLKALLTGASLSVPVAEGRMTLGTWQGIFLIEHRAKAHQRQIALHISGE